MKKRSDLKILSDVLRVAEPGVKLSHIVYRANLNFRIVRGYVETLIKAGLLSCEGRTFKTTGKGFDYIRSLASVESILIPGHESWKQYCSIHPNEELMFGYICSECCKGYNELIREAREARQA